MPSRSLWLHRYAIFVACMTLWLIVAGAMVTSTGSGLSVPDWPTTYNQNMFSYPPSKWVGGIFYEHTHRLIASSVGFLTIILAVWIWRRDPRRWMKHLGFVALGAVIAQGILGGMTVKYLLPTWISVFHGCLAQSFFCIVIAIAVLTSPRWIAGEAISRDRRDEGRFSSSLRVASLVLVAVVFVQLVLGAVMRHTESGLAVPDFPLAYGRVFPDLNDDALPQYNEIRGFDYLMPAVTLSQIAWHMAHRLWAVVVAIVLLTVCTRVLTSGLRLSEIRRPAWAAIVLIGAQIGLGAWTVLSRKNEYVASAHVAVGAATLATVWILSLQIHHYVRTTRCASPRESASLSAPVTA